MSAFALHDDGDRDGIFRWSASAALIVAIHAALIAAGTAWLRQAPPPGVALPMVMIDLAPPSPAPSAPDIKPADVQPPQPEPPREEALQEPAPLAPVEAQPLPQPSPSPEPVIEPTPARPEPSIAVPEPVKPAPAKPKPVHTEAKKPAAAPPRHSPTASEHAASASSAPQGAPNPAAMSAYNQRVAAHLQAFKQYPSAAKAAGEQGISKLSFTIGRNGQVLSSRLAGSSGHPALDGETLAMVRRAQPFPPIPPELKQASISFTVPIRFAIH